MSDLSSCFVRRGIGLGVLLAVMGCGVGAQAAATFNEPFVVGVGDYSVGDLTPQNPPTPGFTSAWTDGTTATSAWNIDATGLDSPVDEGESGGSVSYDGSAGTQRAYRIFDPVNRSVYFFNALLRLDSATDLTGTNVVGITSNQSGVTDTNFFQSTGSIANVEGLIWGFEGDGSQIDLVLRTRKDIDPGAGQTVQMTSETLLSNVTVGQTYQVIFKLEKDILSSPDNVQGNDRVTAWINPTDITSESSAGAFSFQSSNFAINTTLSQLVFASNDFANTAHYDEVRFGGAWGDVAVVNQQIAYDDFQAGADTNVNTGNVNGGTGWSGAWVNDGGTGVFSATTPATPLSAAGVTGDGRALTASGFSNDTNPRSASRSLDGPETGDVFVHFLVRFDGTLDTDDLFDFELLSGGAQAARFGVREGSVGGDFFASVNGGSTGFYGPDFAAGEDHLIVLRLYKNFGADIYNSLSVWIDPGFDDYLNPLITVTGAVNGALTSIDGLNFGQQRVDVGDRVYFDELLLGTSWSQVVPIPEPGALSMLLIGAAGLMRRRRRA